MKTSVAILLCAMGGVLAAHPALAASGKTYVVSVHQTSGSLCMNGTISVYVQGSKVYENLSFPGCGVGGIPAWGPQGKIYRANQSSGYVHHCANGKCSDGTRYTAVSGDSYDVRGSVSSSVSANSIELTEENQIMSSSGQPTTSSSSLSLQVDGGSCSLVSYSTTSSAYGQSTAAGPCRVLEGRRF